MMSPRSPKSIINQFSRRLFWISSSSDIGEYDPLAIGLIFRYSKLDKLKNSRLFPKYSFKSSFEYSIVIILSSRCSCYSCGTCPNVVDNQPLFHLTINQVSAFVLLCLILLWNHLTYRFHYNKEQRVSTHSSDPLLSDTPHVTFYPIVFPLKTSLCISFPQPFLHLLIIFLKHKHTNRHWFHSTLFHHLIY